MTTIKQRRCGFIACIGRANVGKSSLFNQLIGQPISLVNRKAQTTRHYIRGIFTIEMTQAIFIDSPGLDTRHRKFRFNKLINNAFMNLLTGVDVVVWVLDRNRVTTADTQILHRLNTSVQLPSLIVLLNKIDLLQDTGELLPFARFLHERLDPPPVAIIPVSAKRQKGLLSIKRAIAQQLPIADWLYEEGTVSDVSEKFFITETIRGELLKQLNQELPHACAVAVELLERTAAGLCVHAALILESETHKHIVIGAQGKKLKSIGQSARIRLQKRIGCKVEVRLWVKVIQRWRNHTNSDLHSLAPF